MESLAFWVFISCTIITIICIVILTILITAYMYPSTSLIKEITDNN